MNINIFQQPQQWTNKEIEHIFDTNWNITLEQISLLTNKTIEELKELLLPN
jgi:hypothetical protein